MPTLDWWHSFRSRELTGLMEEAQAPTSDIAVAIAQITQADAQVRIAGAPLLPSLSLGGSDTASKASEQTSSAGARSLFSRLYASAVKRRQHLFSRSSPPADRAQEPLRLLAHPFAEQPFDVGGAKTRQAGSFIVCGIAFLAGLFLVPFLHRRCRRRRLSAKCDRTRPRDRHWSSLRSLQGDDYQAGGQFHRSDGHQVPEVSV